MTLAYKVALGCAVGVLLISVVVRWQRVPTAMELAEEAPADERGVVAVAEAEEGSMVGPVVGERAAQAPSKPPPSLESLEVPAGLDASAGGGVLPVPAAGAAELSLASDLGEAEEVPTMTVGRGPDDPLEVAVVSAEPTLVEDEGGALVRTYTVRSGDTFEGIARRELGEASRWDELARANPTVNPLKLRVGDVLKLPGEAEAVAAASLDDAEAALVSADGAGSTLPPPPDPVTYVVGAGDNLSTIAARFYSDSSRWRAIYNANRDRLDSPHAVKIGMELRIPPAIAAAPRSVSRD